MKLRSAVLLAIAVLMLLVWTFPVLWGLLTSLKTERDVLAYPPTLVFEPTLLNYRDVFFGATTILPNLVSSVIVSGLTTVLTMLFAVPAAYALSRLNLPWKKGAGFYVLATQMLPPGWSSRTSSSCASWAGPTPTKAWCSSTSRSRCRSPSGCWCRTSRKSRGKWRRRRSSIAPGACARSGT
jgi:ABC-type Fe3+ transport system permease subunit